MNSKLLIIQNISHEGPGLLMDILLAHGIEYDIFDLSRGELFPPPNAYQAIVVLGGPDSANDTSTKILQELQSIEETLRAEIPYLGICLGFQLLAKACGEKISTCPKKELGLQNSQGHAYTMNLRETTKDEPIFAQQDFLIPVFQLHGESIEASHKTAVLADGNECTTQFIKAGVNAYGIQGHLELTPKMLEIWLKKDPDLKTLNQQQLRYDFIRQFAAYRRHGLLLFSNFLRIAGLIPEQSSSTFL